MSRSPLDAFTHAYRSAHATPLEPTRLLSRIKATLDHRGSRRVRPAWGKGLRALAVCAALGGSVAYAAPFAAPLVAWLRNAVSSPPFDTMPAQSRGGAHGITPAPTTVVVELTSPQGPMTTEAYDDVPSTSGGQPASPNHAARVNQPSLPSSAGMSPAARADALGTSKPAVRSAERATDTERATDEEDPAALFAHAQRLQFVARDYSAALDAWSRYLEVAPDEALVTDGRYARAVCLVQVGRYDEARAELIRLATTKGPHRVHATTLLHGLERVAKPTNHD